MKRVRKEKGNDLFKGCWFLLLCAVLVACRLGSDSETSSNNSNRRESGSRSSSQSEAKSEANAELCRKYESCGCVSYASCMEQFENDPNLEKPGVRECMLNSSCESLCANDPDGCKGQSGGTGTGTGTRSNCAAISCSKNSDCPSDCYGGCDGVRCYSF